MTGNVGHQVFARDTHQIVADVVHIVLDGVGAVPQADVLVDGREALRYGAGTVYRGLVDQRDLQPVRLGPVSRFDGCSARGHSAAHDK